MSWWNSLSDVSKWHTFAEWSLAVLAALTAILVIAALCLNSRQGVLQNLEAAAEKQRSDAALAEANRRISELEPRPLPDRVIAFLNHLDPNILSMARQSGQRPFPVQIQTMTDAQLADLQRLCHEDASGQFIVWIPSTNIIIGQGGPGTQGDIRFSITDELLR